MESGTQTIEDYFQLAIADENGRRTVKYEPVGNGLVEDPTKEQVAYMLAHGLNPEAAKAVKRANERFRNARNLGIVTTKRSVNIS